MVVMTTRQHTAEIQ